MVFWVLIKILKEFSWYAFKKEKRFIYFYNNTYFIQINAFFVYLWILGVFYPLKTIYKLYIYLLLKNEQLLLKGKQDGIFNFLIGKELKTGFYFPTFIKDWDLKVINYLVIERFLSYVLFNKASNALYFYDGNESYLVVERFKHSTTLEYVYGLFPSVIIAFILLPSLYLLYSTDEDIDPAYTIKVIGHQWFWSYEYSGLINGNGDNDSLTLKKFKVNFDSVIISEEELQKGYKRLLETDNILIVPSHRVLRFVITSADVLHSWAIPSLGIKTDAVPGRLNQVLTMICKPGYYYGQCSELCGVSHGFMPIVINSVSESQFNNKIWNE